MSCLWKRRRILIAVLIFINISLFLGFRQLHNVIRTKPKLIRETFYENSTKSMFLDDVKFLLTEIDYCEGRYPNLSILIYVHTAPSHYLHRSVIRNTWGNIKLYHTHNVATIFFVGRSQDNKMEAAIQWESKTYHDIVQGDYLDTYHNLTYKAISALQWIIKYCPRVKYVVKVDDDVFINVFSLSRFIKKIYLKYGPLQEIIFCTVDHNSPIERNKASKWYVPADELKGLTVYPDYCKGYAYLMPVKVIFKLNEAVKDSAFFWIDDVYVTGFLAQKMNISHKGIGYYSFVSPENFQESLLYGDAFFCHGITEVQKREMYWRKIESIEINRI